METKLSDVANPNPAAIIEIERNVLLVPNVDDNKSLPSTGTDTIDKSCNNCVPQSTTAKEQLSLSSLSDDDIVCTPMSSLSDDGTPMTIDLNKKSSGMVQKGMMDIALLTANANQLRFLITYNSEEKTFYISAGLIVLSLIIQLAVGIGLIFKRRMKIKGNRCKAEKISSLVVSGIFCLAVINILAASFTTTTTPSSPTSP